MNAPSASARLSSSAAWSALKAGLVSFVTSVAGLPLAAWWTGDLPPLSLGDVLGSGLIIGFGGAVLGLFGASWVEGQVRPTRRQLAGAFAAGILLMALTFGGILILAGGPITTSMQLIIVLMGLWIGRYAIFPWVLQRRQRAAQKASSEQPAV